MKDRIVQALRDAAGQPWGLMLERRSSLGSIIGDISLGREITDGRLNQIAGVGGADTNDALASHQVIPGARNGKAVAVVSVKGLALYDFEFQPFAFSTRLLAQVVNQLTHDDEIGTIVLDINSPGGVVTGVPEAAEAVFAARQQKRVVALVNPLAASAAYWIASQASEIIAVPSAEVGSIGVFMLHLDFSGALEAEGVKPTFIFAGEHKIEGNALEPLSEEARERFQSDVDTIHGDFVKAVARGRDRAAADVRDNFGRGRVFFPREAKSVGMIDRIETLDRAFSRLGVAPGAMQGRRAEDDSPEPQSITLGQDAAGKVYVLNEWPERIAITRELLDGHAQVLKVDGERLTFTCENGTAEYVKDGEDSSGNWVCRLIESTYEPGWPPQREPEAAEPAHNPRHRRLALLKHA